MKKSSFISGLKSHAFERSQVDDKLSSTGVPEKFRIRMPGMPHDYVRGAVTSDKARQIIDEALSDAGDNFFREKLKFCTSNVLILGFKCSCIMKYFWISLRKLLIVYWLSETYCIDSKKYENGVVRVSTTWGSLDSLVEIFMPEGSVDMTKNTCSESDELEVSRKLVDRLAVFGQNFSETEANRWFSGLTREVVDILQKFNQEVAKMHANKDAIHVTIRKYEKDLRSFEHGSLEDLRSYELLSFEKRLRERNTATSTFIIRESNRPATSAVASIWDSVQKLGSSVGTGSREAILSAGMASQHAMRRGSN